MIPRKRLSDIINGESASFQAAWDETEAAADPTPIPKGEYLLLVLSGMPFNSRGKNTPAYRLEFQVADGPYAGRRLRHDIWLTRDAMAMSKRDLAKFGITRPEQ